MTNYIRYLDLERAMGGGQRKISLDALFRLLHTWPYFRFCFCNTWWKTHGLLPADCLR